MGKTKQQHKDHAGEATRALVEMFETGNMPAAIAETLIRRDQSDAPSANWSLSNQLLMLLAGTQDARGYRQWEKVGRTVKGGSRAFYILAPLATTIKDDETGEKRTFIRGFKGVPVFRIEDTEGDPVEPIDYKPKELPPLYERAVDLGIKVDWAPYVGGFRGFYAPSADYIMLVTHDITTWFHELAHAAHARVETLRGGQNARQEVIAETVAAVLCLMYGVEGYVAHSHAYIASYAAQHKNPAKAVLNVLSTVQKVLDVILEDSVEGATSEES